MTKSPECSILREERERKKEGKETQRKKEKREGWKVEGGVGGWKGGGVGREGGKQA